MAEVDRERQIARAQKTRRNIMAMGVIAGAAVVARARPAKAGQNGQGQNGQGQNGGNHSCFLRGTKIQTVLGERKIEDLAIGDLLPTVFGGIRPIQWIARYRYRKSDPSRPWGKDVLPVRVARSALAPDVPHADLFLTQRHALYVDGALVRVGGLINGATIALYAAEEFDELEFFHIKLETHDLIHVEGAVCETLQSVDENANNFADYYRKYGMPQTEEQPCVPILSYNGGRSQIKSRFRSAISPWFDRRHQFDIIRDRLEERALCPGQRVGASRA